MVVLDGLVHRTEFLPAVELMQQPSVCEWLFASEFALTSDMFLRPIIPFDFLLVEKGPQVGMRETLLFRRSLMVVVDVEDSVCYGYVLKFDASGMLNMEKLIVKLLPTGDIQAIISSKSASGNWMLRGTFIPHSAGFTQGLVFVTQSPSVNQMPNIFLSPTFTRMDRDCDFCIARQDECHCDMTFKTRSSRMVDILSNAPRDQWSVVKMILTRISGMMWMRAAGSDTPVRAHLGVSQSVVFDRVQNIIQLSRVWQSRKAVQLEYAASTSSGSDATLRNESRNETPALIGLNDVEMCSEISGSKEKPQPRKKARNDFECTICNNSFRSSYHLERHRKAVHLRERNHVCTECEKSFSQRSHLTAHIANLHGKPSSIECSNCGVKFSWRSNYLKHMRHKHPQISL